MGSPRPVTIGQVVNLKPLTENVRAALAAATGRPAHFVKLGERVQLDNSSFPYNLLYLIPGGSLDGSFDYPDEHAVVVYQTTAMAKSPEQALWLADRNRQFFLSRNAQGFVHPISDPPGMRIVQRWKDEGLPDVMPGEKALYSVAERFNLSVVGVE